MKNKKKKKKKWKKKERKRGRKEDKEWASQRKEERSCYMLREGSAISFGTIQEKQGMKLCSFSWYL